MLRSSTEIKTIGIAGAGTMGAGIAWVCATSGFKTILFDIQNLTLEKAREYHKQLAERQVEKGRIDPAGAKALLSNIIYTDKLSDLRAEMIIESIIEKAEPKQALFQDLAKINGADCLLCSNTSSIPISLIANGIEHPERVAGFHFFNPAPVMKLIEIISTGSTSSETRHLLFELAKKMGKLPVFVRDSPGFIVNRVARPFYTEGLKIVEEGVCSFETVDQIMQMRGFKMGPFRLMDLIGVDTNFSVTSSMYDSFFQEPKFRPSRIQHLKVLAGHHGRKTGQGFYTYEKK